jgi:hypothetical protein
MRKLALRQTAFGAAILVALLAFACTSKEDEPTPAPTSAADVSVPPTATAGPTEVPTPSPTPVPTDNAGLALAALNDFLSSINAANCSSPSPGFTCNIYTIIGPDSGGDYDHGLGAYRVHSSSGFDTNAVVGKNAAGVWYLYLWGQQLYNPTTLPAPVTLCAFGEKVKVQANPSTSSEVVARLDTGASAQSDQFQLAVPGSLQYAGSFDTQGSGWYRLADPAGWVFSKNVAAGSDCTLHDQIEH